MNYVTLSERDRLVLEQEKEKGDNNDDRYRENETFTTCKE